jgi:hypothetical protein
MSESHPFRTGSVVRAVLVVGTFLFCVAVAAFPLRTWYDQRAELDEAEIRNAALVAAIQESDGRIAAKIDDDGMRRDAKCFSNFIEPGEELYSVPGVRGCVPIP